MNCIRIVTAAAIILSLSYVALLASAFTRTLVWLRLLLIAGAFGFVLYGAVEGIWAMVAWNIVIGSMHAFRVL